VGITGPLESRQARLSGNRKQMMKEMLLRSGSGEERGGELGTRVKQEESGLRGPMENF